MDNNVPQINTDGVRGEPRPDGLTAHASFRCEPELQRAVEELADSFSLTESWAWRVLAVRGLGDGAPQSLRHKFRRFLSGVE